ncbi:ubiquitin-conjugating enzyme E2 [Fodinibius roseus]|nr:ubiquitin-conjugating enzyme E2 [Fodinibius roseus]
MKEGYLTFVNQLAPVIEKYPDFEVASENGKKYLKGNLAIIDDAGKNWGTFQVEIRNKEGFPYRFPKVFETSERIPKIADWHIYKDGSCCIDVLPSEIIKCRDGITIVGFIENELTPYLFNQTYRMEEGFYVNSGYAHGLMGIYEFFSSKLETGNDIRKTLFLMNYIATKPRLNRSNKCFCGSNELFRKCHMKAYDELNKLDKSFLLDQIELIYHRSGLKTKNQLRKNFT